jgi:hypothetical protein
MIKFCVHYSFGCGICASGGGGGGCCHHIGPSLSLSLLLLQQARSLNASCKLQAAQ